LVPLTVFGVVLGAVVTAVTEWDKLQEQYEKRPLIMGGLVAGTVLLVAWKLIDVYAAKRLNNRLIAMRSLLVLIVLITYVGLVIAPRFCFLTNWCGPAPYVPEHLSLLATPAFGMDKPALEILSVTVDQVHSTFFMSDDDMSIHGVRESVARTSLRFDRQMQAVFESASCRGISGEGPIEDVLPVWRSLLKDRGRTDLVQKLSDYDGYRNLLQHGGDRGFNDARPTKAELVDLMKKKPEWYSLILRWLVECVGVADPVLIWTLRNNSDKDLTLNAVDYQVLEIGQVKGAGPDTLEPLDVLPHDLVHSQGTQTRNISPQVVLHPSNTAAIRIFYRLDGTDWGYTWLVRPVFRTLEGPSAAGPELKIFGAKKQPTGDRQ
jgi:hypothetical protein